MENNVFIFTMIFILVGILGFPIYLYFFPTRQRGISIESIEEYKRSQ